MILVRHRTRLPERTRPLSNKTQLVKNTVASGAAQVVQMASSLVFMPLLINTFGIGSFGLYMLTSSVSGYASLLDLGVGSSVVKFVAEHSARDENEDISKVVSSALTFYIIVGVIAAAIFWGIGLSAGGIFRITADQARLVRNLFFVGGFMALVSWPTSTAYHVLGGLRRYDLLARNQMIAAVANALVAVAVIVTKQGPLALLSGNAVVAISLGLLNAWSAKQLLGGVAVSPSRFSRETLNRIMRFSWAVFIAQVTIVIVYQQTDRLVLGVFIGAAAVGLYEAAAKFQTLIAQLIGMTNTAIMPTTSRMQAEESHDALRQLFLRGTKYVAALINPVVVIVIVLAHPLITHWLGWRFEPVVISAQVLLSYQLLLASTSVGDSMIVGIGKLPKRIPYILAIAAANLALSIALVPRLGIMGVVLGTTIPWFVEYPSHIAFLLKHLDVPFRHWARQVIVSTYPLLLVPAAVAWLGILLGFTGSLLTTIAVAAVSATAYWGCIFALGLTDQERDDARTFLAAAKTRLTRS